MAGELILVVDDEPNIIELARLYLEKEGFRVAEACGGEEALRLFEELSPALVVLDIMIPEPDGWEVCRRIRSRSRLPIIKFTPEGGEVALAADPLPGGGARIQVRDNAARASRRSSWKTFSTASYAWSAPAPSVTGAQGWGWRCAAS